MLGIVSTQKEYFENLYQDSVDPFRNWINDYEVNKRDIAIKLLQHKRYDRIFEPGCGNGGLSKELARVGDQVVSVDWSEDALAAARVYCSAPNVEFQEVDFPKALPDMRGGLFDLMIVSEMLYYYSPEALMEFFAAIPRVLEEQGEIMLIHWRGVSPDYPMNGDAVHKMFHELPFIKVLRIYEDQQFLISSGTML